MEQGHGAPPVPPTHCSLVLGEKTSPLLPSHQALEALGMFADACCAVAIARHFSLRKLRRALHRLARSASLHERWLLCFGLLFVVWSLKAHPHKHCPPLTSFSCTSARACVSSATRVRLFRDNPKLGAWFKTRATKRGDFIGVIRGDKRPLLQQQHSSKQRRRHRQHQPHCPAAWRRQARAVSC